MFDVDRILAIPDQSIDYLQMGIAGKERAALAARGFVRKDGTKAKDYMIRTIQKTAKNKAKTEKAVIKGDKKLSALEQFQKTQPFVNALTDGESIVAVTPKGRKLEISYNKKDGYIRPHAVIKNLDSPSQEVIKNPMTKDQLHTYIANFEDVKIKPQSTKKLTVTYSKKGVLSSANVAKKIKGAIAGTTKSKKVTKSKSPDNRVPKKLGKLSNPVRELVIPDYPLGGNKRGEMRFSVESHPTKGERIVRQSKGNKPKYSTYSTKKAIVTGENGRTYFLSHEADYGLNRVSQHDFKDASEDYKLSDGSFRDSRKPESIKAFNKVKKFIESAK